MLRIPCAVYGDEWYPYQGVIRGKVVTLSLLFNMPRLVDGEFHSDVIQLIENLSEDEIKGLAFLDVDELNTFLCGNGFDIELEELDPASFGVSSIFKVIIKWKVQRINVGSHFDE